jgi:hypothetical protein
VRKSNLDVSPVDVATIQIKRAMSNILKYDLGPAREAPETLENRGFYASPSNINCLKSCLVHAKSDWGFRFNV